jgi:hypothetical protein
MKAPLLHGCATVKERKFRLSANRRGESYTSGYRFYATLRDDLFEPAEIIFNLMHYLRGREFEKIGKRILSDIGNRAVA